MSALFRSPPIQDPITVERIQGMLALSPRRVQLGNGAEWTEALHPPKPGYANWTLVLPFCETLANCFHLMCDVPGSGLRNVKGERCQAFLDDANENPASLERVRA